MDSYPTSNSALIETLKLQKHPEGGYFVETDRQPADVPSPFAGEFAKGIGSRLRKLTPSTTGR